MCSSDHKPFPDMKRPGFTGEFFVQNLRGSFKGVHARMECILPVNQPFNCGSSSSLLFVRAGVMVLFEVMASC